MNIVFDVHIANPNLPDEVSEEEALTLNEIYLFVQERLEPLRGQIEAEEMNAQDRSPGVVIYLKNNAIQARNYSDKLTEKIYACFSENDGYIIGPRISDKLGRLLN